MCSMRFRSAPPRGGDRVEDTEWFHRHVSIRAPARGRLRVDPVMVGLRGVSIRAPARGRQATRASSVASQAFRSAPPRGGDGAPPCGRLADQEFRSAPPRGGDPPPPQSPAASPPLFRSAPPRGGDSPPGACHPTGDGFDPRPREGATWSVPHPSTPLRVSIRAPARGRPLVVGQRIVPVTFRSAPPRGGDRAGSGGQLLAKFRSAPPRGGDPLVPPSRVASASFDPRPREGATSYFAVAAKNLNVSIRAPARGRRL